MINAVEKLLGMDIERSVIEGVLKRIKKTMADELKFLIDNMDGMKKDYGYKNTEDIAKRFSNEVIYRAWKDYELHYFYRQEKVTRGKGLFEK